MHQYWRKIGSVHSIGQIVKVTVILQLITSASNSVPIILISIVTDMAFQYYNYPINQPSLMKLAKIAFYRMDFVRKVKNFQ